MKLFGSLFKLTGFMAVSFLLSYAALVGNPYDSNTHRVGFDMERYYERVQLVIESVKETCQSK